MLAVTSVHTLKRGNKKSGKKKSFLLAEELIDVDINKEEVEKSVEVLIKTLNPECLSLLKESTKRSQEVVEKNQKTAYFS